MTSVLALQSARVLRLPVMLAIRRALFHAAERSWRKCRDYSAGLDQKWLAMAFGMPEANLSSRRIARNAAKNRQLDILACGMPKTFQSIFL
ncbi:hypothetical protein [Bradyrhizobium sp. Cp5.3]|uniref:hypothetical protein n=1 Tax=Bradyrhizobium sp. Cp5.3 TaxID=443598 RepID=UPI0018DEC088|nr:hypothetical protein [Bradyrhizobium sp. Cp5.3]